jgi:hypothetical protein
VKGVAKTSKKVGRPEKSKLRGRPKLETHDEKTVKIVRSYIRNKVDLLCNNKKSPIMKNVDNFLEESEDEDDLQIKSTRHRATRLSYAKMRPDQLVEYATGSPEVAQEQNERLEETLDIIKSGF